MLAAALVEKTVEVNAKWVAGGAAALLGSWLLGMASSQLCPQALAPRARAPPSPRPQEEPECAVCFGSLESKVALVPCGHCLCADCEPRFAECPVCDEKKQNALRVYN